jgi:hypothetical protein
MEVIQYVIYMWNHLCIYTRSVVIKTALYMKCLEKWRSVCEPEEAHTGLTCVFRTRRFTFILNSAEILLLIHIFWCSGVLCSYRGLATGWTPPSCTGCLKGSITSGSSSELEGGVKPDPLKLKKFERLNTACGCIIGRIAGESGAFYLVNSNVIRHDRISRNYLFLISKCIILCNKSK